MKQSHRLTAVLCMLMSATLLLTACSPAATTAVPTTVAQPISGAPATLKIGIMGSFTGDSASLGTEQLKFARLAVADFNKKLGLNVQLDEEDMQSDTDKATTIAQKLVSDKDVLAVIGPTGSQTAGATATLFEDAKLAHVSPSATLPKLTSSGYKTFFRVIPNDSKQAPTDTRLLADTLKAKSVFIIDDQSSYSKSLADEVQKELGGMGVQTARESVTENSDFSALVTKIKAAKADAVFFPGIIADQGAQLWKQMQEQGVKATLVGGDSFLSSDLLVDGANEGSYVTNFAPDIHGVPEAADVVKAYTATNGDFTAFGPPAYVATQVIMEALARAVKAGTVTREAVLVEIAKTNIDKSILDTPIKFDANGDVEGAQFDIFQVKGGKFQLVQP